MKALATRALLLLTLLASAIRPTVAAAWGPADFNVVTPPLAVELVYSSPVRDPATAFWTVDGDFAPKTGANGALIALRTGEPLSLVRLDRTGQIETLVTWSGNGDAAMTGFVSDPNEGSVWLIFGPNANTPVGAPQLLVFKLRGLPHVLSSSGCPNPPGDLAPGSLDTTAQPATWHPVGDGSVNVGDVVTLLNAAVGRFVVDCTP